MTAQSNAVDRDQLQSRGRDRPAASGARRAVRPYVVGVPAPSPAVRRDKFRMFVRHAVQRAAEQRGWTVGEIARQSGRRVDKSTILKWMADGADEPQGRKVEAFCDTLDIPASTPLAILWPGKDARRQATPPTLDPDVVPVARRLADPRVAQDEKDYIRFVLRGLAARPTRHSGSA